LDVRDDSILTLMRLSTVGKLALDLLYPPKCAICGTGGVFLCGDCEDSMPPANGPRCDRCWSPLTKSGVCSEAAYHAATLDRLRSVFRYEADARHLVHKLKYGGQSSLAPDLARLMADAMQRHGLEPDALVPVPLTSQRRRIRGYNQAGLIAREISKFTNVPVREALQRKGHSNTQASSQSAEQRRQNVSGVFSLVKGADVAGASLLLIDDVATTGATLGACAAILKAADAAEVAALTLARED
jgi:competence protein ComFC